MKCIICHLMHHNIFLSNGISDEALETHNISQTAILSREPINTKREVFEDTEASHEVLSH